MFCHVAVLCYFGGIMLYDIRRIMLHYKQIYTMLVKLPYVSRNSIICSLQNYVTSLEFHSIILAELCYIVITEIDYISIIVLHYTSGLVTLNIFHYASRILLH